MTYTVKQGDTLYGISNQYGVSVMDLMKVNSLQDANIKPGQILKIPSTEGTNPDNTFIYTVKKGDSLYSIAKNYATTVDTIIKLNDLKSNNLSIGQKLLIPEKYSNQSTLPNYLNYTVKKGDNLYNLSQKYGVPIETIIKDNALSTNTLSIGQNLKIRITSEEGNTIEDECFGTEYTPPSTINTINYIVKKGDSLYKIANAYNVSVSDIIRLNNLTTNNLSIGQVLKVPQNSTSSIERTYIVQKGDSLYSIAKKFGVSVEEIKRKNNLSNNLLSIGQSLKI